MQDFPAQLRLHDHGNWRSGKCEASRAGEGGPFIRLHECPIAFFRRKKLLANDSRKIDDQHGGV